jgi:hypothetical protein
MEEKPVDMKALLGRIFELEKEIADWRCHNSQSNPGAVMELRSMKKELEKLKQIWKALSRGPPSACP